MEKNKTGEIIRVERKLVCNLCSFLRFVVFSVSQNRGASRLVSVSRCMFWGGGKKVVGMVPPLGCLRIVHMCRSHVVPPPRSLSSLCPLSAAF